MEFDKLAIITNQENVGLIPPHTKEKILHLLTSFVLQNVPIPVVVSNIEKLLIVEVNLNGRYVCPIIYGIGTCLSVFIELHDIQPAIDYSIYCKYLLHVVH